MALYLKSLWLRKFCLHEELKKGNDPVLIFWKAFGMFKEGAVTDAIREVEYIKERREVSYAAHMALIYYHDHCWIVDKDAIEHLKF